MFSKGSYITNGRRTFHKPKIKQTLCLIKKRINIRQLNILSWNISSNIMIIGKWWCSHCDIFYSIYHQGSKSKSRAEAKAQAPDQSIPHQQKDWVMCFFFIALCFAELSWSKGSWVLLCNCVSREAQVVRNVGPLSPQGTHCYDSGWHAELQQNHNSTTSVSLSASPSHKRAITTAIHFHRLLNKMLK